MGKLDHSNDHKICGKLPENDTVKTPVISIFFFNRLPRIKTDQMLNKLMHTESAARHIYHMRVKMDIATEVREVDNGKIEI
jgi:hypothetical protein